MARKLEKPFACGVISQLVSIRLRRRPLGGRNDLFVQCSESDCQYVDANEPPCPLTTELFAGELLSRETRRDD